MTKILCYSDLHGHLPNQSTESDIVLIAGDIAPHFPVQYTGDEFDKKGQQYWIMTQFLSWADSLPTKKVFYTGDNHDYGIESCPLEIDLSSDKTQLVIDNTVEFEGIKIFLSPLSLWFYDWAFNAPKQNGEKFLECIYGNIPSDIDIVVSHGPPLGYGDKTFFGKTTGSKSLLDVIDKLKPKLVVTGHIHESYGIYHRNETKIVNASINDIHYEPVNKPIMVEI